jgi:hypothetical protein
MGYTDEFGDYHSESGDESIFKSGSKLYGNAQLGLQAPPAWAFGGNHLWPRTCFDTAARNGAQVLIDVDTKDEKGHVFTVTLGQIAPSWGFPFVQNSELIAVVEIGFGGLMTLAEIDFLTGTQFSVMASHLRVYGVWRVVAGGVMPVADSGTYQVGASLATGVIAHGRQPQRTLGKRQSAPAWADTWYIPAFAKSFRVTADPAASQLNVAALDSTGASAGNRYTMAASPSVDIPLNSSTELVTVANASAQVTSDYALIFELAL